MGPDAAKRVSGTVPPGGGRFSLLNAIAGGSFTWDIQNILWEDLLLRVCRLTDPIESGRGKPNLTVNRLPMYCEHEPQLCDQVKHLAESASNSAKFARKWRNQRISHSDWNRGIEKADPLPPASLEKVAAALDAVHTVLNTVSLGLLKEGIANSVTGRPRARAFLSYARQLAESVKSIDALIDPSGGTSITDVDVADDFLRKLVHEPSEQQFRQIIDLREAARRFP